LSQSTHLTDGRTEFSSQDHVCIPCSAVKMMQNLDYVLSFDSHMFIVQVA